MAGRQFGGTRQAAPISKADRQRLIQTVVSQREVGTQRELVAALRQLGCEVTQATVSRDIRELDLQKVRTHLGRPRYVMSLREHPRDPEQAASHVLRDFSTTENKSLPFLIDNAADAVEMLVTSGLAAAQEKFR